MNEWIGFWCCTLESLPWQRLSAIFELTKKTWIILISHSRVHYIFFPLQM